MGTRLQIREDIRKMRNPKMHEIKMILKTLGIGFEKYINHKAYYHQPQQQEDVYLDDVDDDDGVGEEEEEEEEEDMNNEVPNDIQFIQMHSKRKKKKKKKRKRRHYEFDQNGSSTQTSASFIMNREEPHRKKIKMNNNSDAIKCRKCNRIFTLEVDLLLHKTNDHCK